MPAARDSVLSPAVVAAVDDLELAARLVVEGMRTGGHASPFHGYSAEFRQHRAYRPGDDLKYVDWKLYARSGRVYTRQFRETTNVPVMLVLDASASMAYPAVGHNTGIQKFRYAAILAAALAWVTADQGNAVGVMTTVHGGLRYVPARGGRQHLRSLIALLDRVEPAGTWDPARVIDRAAQLLKRRGIVVVLSDFYDDEEGTGRALRRVTRHGHDVSVLQVLAPDEVALADEGQVEFEDLETGERRLADAQEVSARHRDGMRAFIARVRAGAARAGIDHARLSTDIAPERALRDWLQRRGAHHLAGHGHLPANR